MWKCHESQKLEEQSTFMRLWYFQRQECLYPPLPSSHCQYNSLIIHLRQITAASDKLTKHTTTKKLNEIRINKIHLHIFMKLTPSQRGRERRRFNDFWNEYLHKQLAAVSCRMSLAVQGCRKCADKVSHLVFENERHLTSANVDCFVKSVYWEKEITGQSVGRDRMKRLFQSYFHPLNWKWLQCKQVHKTG